MADFDSIWSPAKVFSPTAAKQASLQQKDWAYVDEFLASRFFPSPVPKFERNADTLKALLALAAANEAADEEKLLERRVEKKALEELKRRDTALEEARKGKGEPLLAAVEENLTPEGRRCLNSAALMSVALATNSADPQKYAKFPTVRGWLLIRCEGCRLILSTCPCKRPPSRRKPSVLTSSTPASNQMLALSGSPLRDWKLAVNTSFRLTSQHG
jgi:hypothetical protein